MRSERCIQEQRYSSMETSFTVNRVSCTLSPMERKMIQILSASLFIVMLLWGGYTLLYYLGVPVHGAVLLPDDVHKSLEGICAGDDVVCRGAFALFGVLWHSLTRVPFVIWYAVTCIVLYALVLAWRYVRTLRWNAEIVLKPWHVLALCFASMWLLFTCLSLSNNGDLPFNHLIEPLPDVYKNAGPQAIVALRENYDALKERGCLKPIGTFGAAEASEITFFCFQTSFFTRVVPPLIFTLLFLCELLVLGRFLLRKALRISTDSLLEEAVLSLGVGACTMVAALWVLAVAHVFGRWRSCSRWCCFGMHGIGWIDFCMRSGEYMCRGGVRCCCFHGFCSAILRSISSILFAPSRSDGMTLEVT